MMTYEYGFDEWKNAADQIIERMIEGDTDTFDFVDVKMLGLALKQCVDKMEETRNVISDT